MGVTWVDDKGDAVVGVGWEDLMANLEKRKGSGLSVLDTVLVVGAAIGGIFVLLWALRIAAGLFFFAFKLAVVVLVIVVIVRIVHLFSRRGS